MPQPWYRVATIMSAMHMYDASDRSITTASTLATDETMRKTLKDLRAKNVALRERHEASMSPEERTRQEAAAKRRMCFTHLLPHDVLIMIAEAGLATDPDFALRMAGVCSDWRRTMLSYSSLWTRLRVPKRRPVQKIELWMDRNRGALRELSVTNNLLELHRESVGQVLAPHVEGVERITLEGETGVYFLKCWEGKCLHIRSVEARQISHYINVFDLFHPSATQLESIDGFTMFEDKWKQRPSHIQSLRRADFTAILRDPQASLLSLFQGAPLLSDLCCNVRHLYTHLSLLPDSSTEAISLPNLTRLEVGGHTSMDVVIPAGVRLPNLEHFSCYNLLLMSGSLSPVGALRRAEVSWSKLVSLEFGWRCPPEQTDLIPLLPSLTALKFLCLPHCATVDNTLIEALVVEDGKPVLLPNLTALSIVDNEHISAGPLRRLVLSRNAPEAYDKFVKSTAAPQAKRKSSAFAPMRKAVPSDSPPPSVSPAASSAPRPVVAKLDWLCLDRCSSPYLDDRILDHIRPYMSFLSRHSGSSSTSASVHRMRGRGMYSWANPPRSSVVDQSITAKRKGRAPASATADDKRRTLQSTRQKSEKMGLDVLSGLRIGRCPRNLSGIEHSWSWPWACTLLSTSDKLTAVH